jgi:hypothetical protein
VNYSFITKNFRRNFLGLGMLWQASRLSLT